VRNAIKNESFAQSLCTEHQADETATFRDANGRVSTWFSTLLLKSFPSRAVPPKKSNLRLA
jgi:hypothetical protein